MFLSRPPSLRGDVINIWQFFSHDKLPIISLMINSQSFLQSSIGPIRAEQMPPSSSVIGWQYWGQPGATLAPVSCTLQCKQLNKCTSVQLNIWAEQSVCTTLDKNAVTCQKRRWTEYRFLYRLAIDKTTTFFNTFFMADFCPSQGDNWLYPSPLPSTAKWLIRAVIFVRCANLPFFLLFWF